MQKSKKRKFLNRGAANIPIIIGLLLIGIALPAALRLVQQQQETRRGATYTCPICKSLEYSCAHYGLKPATGTCPPGERCCKPIPTSTPIDDFTCPVYPTMCNGDQFSCAHYGLMSDTGTCPPGERCCKSAGSITPTPTPTRQPTDTPVPPTDTPIPTDTSAPGCKPCPDGKANIGPVADFECDGSVGSLQDFDGAGADGWGGYIDQYRRRLYGGEVIPDDEKYGDFNCDGRVSIDDLSVWWEAHYL
jgi:hypothetical protein